MKYDVYRILGNDLPPRHNPNQTYINLKYMLENETDFPDVRKIFILNRIVDSKKEAQYRTLLEHHSVEYRSIPFVPESYSKMKRSEDKVRYVCNVNGARNKCITDSRKDSSRIAVVLDGAAYLNDDGWTRFDNAVYAYPNRAVYGMWTHRALSFEEIENLTFLPELKERYKFGDLTRVGMRECYLAFTNSADKLFNENLYYGKVDKAYTLWQYGIPGVWDYWEGSLRREALRNKSKYFEDYEMGGYAIRLPSHSITDGDNAIRGESRAMGIQVLISKLDSELA